MQKVSVRWGGFPEFFSGPVIALRAPWRLFQAQISEQPSPPGEVVRGWGRARDCIAARLYNGRGLFSRAAHHVWMQ
jgi:hypothetical protein